ncbi:MAG: hypothetical protein JNM88_06365 [Chitinophagaceae bacterium]|nr:hypothetical protein [Chitinophagaceae bacterium]
MATSYADMYKTVQIKADKKAEVNLICKRIKAGQTRYESVAKTLANGIPWWFIGITHFMEAGGKKDPFLFHLHCGDPLTARTVHVPAGRPKANPGGGPNPPSKTNPYSWEESALDALRLMGYNKVSNWDIQDCLVLFEQFNGLGYKKKGVPSPYLWSYTQFYTSGKYVADGKYDPKAVSKQPGVAAMMKGLGV